MTDSKDLPPLRVCSWEEPTRVSANTGIHSFLSRERVIGEDTPLSGLVEAGRTPESRSCRFEP
jgi:hypothetical protein